MNATPQGLSIRPYRAGDALVTLRIFTVAITETAAADYSSEQVEAWAQPGQIEVESWHHAMHRRNSFVAAVHGEVVGFSDVDRDGYIDMMFVDPQHQRQGVARALLAEAERQAGELCAAQLTADVSITARPFFESQGFFVDHLQEFVQRGVRFVNFRMRKLLHEQRDLGAPAS